MTTETSQIIQKTQLIHHVLVSDATDHLLIDFSDLFKYLLSRHLVSNQDWLFILRYAKTSSHQQLMGSIMEQSLHLLTIDEMSLLVQGIQQTELDWTHFFPLMAERLVSLRHDAAETQVMDQFYAKMCQLLWSQFQKDTRYISDLCQLLNHGSEFSFSWQAWIEQSLSFLDSHANVSVACLPMFKIILVKGGSTLTPSCLDYTLSILVTIIFSALSINFEGVFNESELDWKLQYLQGLLLDWKCQLTHEQTQLLWKWMMETSEMDPSFRITFRSILKHNESLKRLYFEEKLWSLSPHTLSMSHFEIVELLISQESGLESMESIDHMMGVEYLLSVCLYAEKEAVKQAAMSLFSSIVRKAVASVIQVRQERFLTLCMNAIHETSKFFIKCS